MLTITVLFLKLTSAHVNAHISERRRDSIAESSTGRYKSVLEEADIIFKISELSGIVFCILTFCGNVVLSVNLGRNTPKTAERKP